MIKIKRTTSNNPDFVKLASMLDRDLYSRYNQEQNQYDQLNKIEFLQTVIVAYTNDEAAGCGCYKQYDEKTIEIKRMFVIPEMRGGGIAKKILHELEAWGVQKDFTKSILETGIGQPEAINLYKKLGYKIIPNYGQYADMPNSVCMEKFIHLLEPNIIT